MRGSHSLHIIPESIRSLRLISPLFKLEASMMTHLPKEWRFLPDAWSYAVILTGSAQAATDLVTNTLNGVATRHDILGNKHRRRVFFATLFREANKAPRVELPGSNLSDDILELHRLSEPGRSALALFHLCLFPIDQIADIVGKNEKQLPELLVATRGALTSAPRL
jgi:hypothetical protein